MRIVAWNMRSGTDRKWPALRGLAADVAVLSEVARAPGALATPTLGEPELSWEWEGLNATKGLAVAGWDVPLRRRGSLHASGRWSVAGGLGPLLVVGIWSCPRSGPYAREVERALDAYASLMSRSRDVVVAGDFNVDPHDPTFAALCGRLTQLGLTSAYHAATGEPFGGENASTLVVGRGETESHSFVDYVWVSASLLERLVSVEIAAHAGSDHAPVVVDLSD